MFFTYIYIYIYKYNHALFRKIRFLNYLHIIFPNIFLVKNKFQHRRIIAVCTYRQEQNNILIADKNNCALGRAYLHVLASSNTPLIIHLLSIHLACVFSVTTTCTSAKSTYATMSHFSYANQLCLGEVLEVFAAAAQVTIIPLTNMNTAANFRMKETQIT